MEMVVLRVRVMDRRVKGKGNQIDLIVSAVSYQWPMHSCQCEAKIDLIVSLHQHYSAQALMLSSPLFPLLHYPSL
jgi:hypothetical protein